MTEHLNFWFDPACPFAWMTSRWVRIVQTQRKLSVDWRFISLRHINAAVDYSTHFPAGYEELHTEGRRLLRMAATVRSRYGRDAVGPLYEALGTRIHAEPAWSGTLEIAVGALVAVGLPTCLADSLDDASRDAEIAAESEAALAAAGRDVGTPVLQFGVDGPAFFGPVMSRLPDERGAVELWDHVVGLARFPGFSELKRSLREPLPVPSVPPSSVPFRR